MKFTPKLESFLIKKLNEEYKGINKDPSISDLDENLKKIPWDKFFEEFNANKEFVSKLDGLKKTVGEDKALTLVSSFIHLVDPTRSYRSLDKKYEFASFPAPKELEETLHVWDWESDLLGGMDLKEILKSLPNKQVEGFLKKLPFKAVYKDGDLVAIYPTKNKKFSFYFNLETFLSQAQKSIEKESKLSSINKEQLIEDIASVLIEAIDADDEYYSGEKYALESDNESYAADEARHKDLDDLLDNLDSEITSYVEKLLEKNVSEEEIKQLLIDSASGEYNDSYLSLDNSISSFGLSSEEYSEGDRYEDIEGFRDTSKFPYPDLSSNLALLDEEGIEELKSRIERNTSSGVRFYYDKTTDTWYLKEVNIYTGDNRSIELVVDSRLFISQAKRYLKDAKIMKKHQLGV